MSMATSNKSNRGGKRDGAGRPSVNPPELNKRYMIRTADSDLALWEAIAQHTSLGNASVFARKSTNDNAAAIMAGLPEAQQAAIRDRAAKILRQSRTASKD